MSDTEKTLSITWSQFEVCNPDTRAAFENMCRFLFNAFFFQGKGLFHSDSNNPGVEIIPILYEETGQRISFQAKYFTAIDYSQIKHSAEKAIKYYTGKLDAIYLYCNKDLTTTSASYQDICNLLHSHNIALIPITNQAILDQVLSNNTVAWYYFDYYHLSSVWFEEHLQLSLSALGPRYNRNFNVNTGTENQLDIFLCNNSAVAQINNAKKELAEQLKNSQHKYSGCIESLTKIIHGILSIKDVTRTTIMDCLSWPTILSKQCTDEFSVINDLISEKKKQHSIAKETDDHKLQVELSKEIQNLENLLNLLNHIGLNTLDRALLEQKVLIVGGEAGVGKSQLLANAAEKLNKDGQYALLMLGNSFLGAETVVTQITQQLGIDFSFQTLLCKLEMIGAQSNYNVCLLIDAVNESPYRDIWKTGFSSLIAQINRFEHLKLVISVRSGYERMVFSDVILEGIEKRRFQILSIVDLGRNQ